MILIFKNIFKKPKNSIGLLVIAFIVFVILRVLPVLTILRVSFNLPGLSPARKIALFNEYIFSVFAALPFQEQLLTLLLSFFFALNLVLFVLYARRQMKILSGRSFAAGLSGMFLGVFGVGCLSCGVLIIAPLLSLLGLGAFMSDISHYALLISYAGLFVIILSNVYLLKQLAKPLVC